jgi:hypothetical protein
MGFPGQWFAQAEMFELLGGEQYLRVLEAQ